MSIPQHIKDAIESAKKAGHKKVRGYTGGWGDAREIEDKLNSGEVEGFVHDGIQLLRKPVKRKEN